MDGQQYHALTYNATPPSHSFTYFALDHALGVSVRAITPSGGSLRGGTLVTVRGTGFLRGTWATTATGERSEDLSRTLAECWFGAHGRVPASILSPEALACVSPPRSSAPFTGNESTFPIEVGVNGESYAFTRRGVAPFSYHDPSHVQSIHPLGGHEVGGTLVTITGTHFRELDHGNGLQCLFSLRDRTPDHSHPVRVATAANLTDATDAHAAFVTCFTPPYEQLTRLGVCTYDPVDVRVTNNGVAGPHDISVDAVTFMYFNTTSAVPGEPPLGHPSRPLGPSGELRGRATPQYE